MMVTGHDSVFVSARSPASAVGRFLDSWAARWPRALVGIDTADNGNFVSWQEARNLLPPELAEIFIARDAAMLAAWDEHGYEIPDDDEGPLSILYEPCLVPTFSAQVSSDPYGDGAEFAFRPYGVVFVGAGLTLVTLVTPGENDNFSTEASEILVSSFA